ncbi:MAG: hypothetical protein M3Q69_17615 [Acidobacteriota bacterium]|nr:hypothetical protein [Acidobacteriota bacterium]
MLIAGDTEMSEYHFEAEITGKLELNADALRERVYRGEGGVVGLRVDWPMAQEAPSLRVAIDVVAEVAARDVPAFVELFFHDAFLMMNIAKPGSFGGVIATSGGEFRVNELTLSTHLFDAARTRATLPLQQVIAWYDSLQIGTRQIAESEVETVLFHLLHLARGAETEPLELVRLALCGNPSAELLRWRDALVRGEAAVVHPMQDDALDPRVEDPSLDWTIVADQAASSIISALQSSCARFHAAR